MIDLPLRAGDLMKRSEGENGKLPLKTPNLVDLAILPVRLFVFHRNLTFVEVFPSHATVGAEFHHRQSRGESGAEADASFEPTLQSFSHRTSPVR